MSLPIGGRFDIAGTSGGSHIYHRFGIEFDVNHAVYDAAGNYLADTDEDGLDYVALIVLQGQKVQEANIHYRLPAADIDAIITAGGF